MSKKIQIFVNFGMGGKRSATIGDITSKTTIKDFMQKIIDKEGAEGVRIIFGGKQLEETRNGKTMTLEDYGLYNEATCHAALRLRGGAMPKGGGAIKFDEYEVVSLFLDAAQSKSISGYDTPITDTRLCPKCYEVKYKQYCVYCANYET